MLALPVGPTSANAKGLHRAAEQKKSDNDSEATPLELSTCLRPFPYAYAIMRGNEFDTGHVRSNALKQRSTKPSSFGGEARVGSHLKFQTVQYETFQSVQEISGTYRNSSDVKSISSMTSEDFSEVS